MCRHNDHSMRGYHLVWGFCLAAVLCACGGKDRPLWPLADKEKKTLWQDLSSTSVTDSTNREILELFFQSYPNIPELEKQLSKYVEEGREDLLPVVVRLLEMRLMHDVRMALGEDAFQKVKIWINKCIQRRISLDYGFELLTYQLEQEDSSEDAMSQLPSRVSLVLKNLVFPFEAKLSRREARKLLKTPAAAWILNKMLDEPTIPDEELALLSHVLNALARVKQEEASPVGRVRIEQLMGCFVEDVRRVFPKKHLEILAAFSSDKLLLEFLSSLYPDYESGPLMADPALVKLFFNPSFSRWLLQKSKGTSEEIEDAITEVRSTQENRTLGEVGEL